MSDKTPRYQVLTALQATEPIEYRPINGHSSYRVGSDGTVWSQKSMKWKILKPAPISRECPHLAVKLYPGRKSRLAHRLVLEAFVGPCPSGMECCHWDGDHQNNKLSNLRWDTRQGNRLDMTRHGTLPIGERSSKAKLTEIQVRQIRQLLVSGLSMRRIGNQFGVSDVAVSAIKHGKSWSHVA